MDHVGELDRIANEEHGEVGADQIPIAILGVELHGKAARVARQVTDFSVDALGVRQLSCEEKS